MEPRFFSILGLAPAQDRDRSGLNDPRSHRDDEPWRLGDVPDSLIAAFRTRPVGVQAGIRRPARESTGDAVAHAS